MSSIYYDKFIHLCPCPEGLRSHQTDIKASKAHPPHPRDKHDDDGCKVEEPAQEAEPADLQLAYVSLSGEHIQSVGSCGDDDDDEDNH